MGHMFAMDFPLKFYLRRYTELCFKRKAAHHDLIGLRKLLDNGILEQLFYEGVSQEIWDRLYALQDDLEAYLASGKIIFTPSQKKTSLSIES